MNGRARVDRHVLIRQDLAAAGERRAAVTSIDKNVDRKIFATSSWIGCSGWNNPAARKAPPHAVVCADQALAAAAALHKCREHRELTHLCWRRRACRARRFCVSFDLTARAEPQRAGKTLQDEQRAPRRDSIGRTVRVLRSGACRCLSHYSHERMPTASC